MKIIVTGSSGLIGSSVCEYFNSLGWEIHGVDNNLRATFFGPEGDDIRDRQGVLAFIQQINPDAIVHCAAQPSHDRAAAIPFDDFDTNAVGTLNLLEATRQYATDAPFVFMSTNKVYGDAPNYIAMREDETRWEYNDLRYENGISESFPIDRSKHSLFGASKVAADIMVQEYGKYFAMKTCCLRGGCLTGPSHSGVELHGFLSYLVKCNIEGRLYKIYGYSGKQVRDNIHSFDVARFIHAFIEKPFCGEVYNIGGGKDNSCSIYEAIAKVESLSGKKMIYEYVDENRIGDHICYYSDLRKMREHYPEWNITVSLNQIFEEIIDGWGKRMTYSEKTMAI
jgi:CDP-paratose 2-epimerase